MEQQITADQLKNMTPEQIAELQKQNCIFCHIIAGRVQSRKIYEDDIAFAVLDINPANPGHILVMPKEHSSIMPQLSEQNIGHLFMVAKALSNACLRALHCQGTNIFVANGVAAGQKAPHFMIHIIPRKDGDGFTSLNLAQKEFPKEELDEVQKKIKKALADIMGLNGKEPIDLDKSEEKAPEKEEKKEKPKKPEKPKEAVVDAEVIDETEKPVEEEKEKDDDSGDIDIDTIAKFMGGGQ